MQTPDLTKRLEAFLDDLYHRTGRGIVPGLDAVAALTERLGSPHLRLKAVHVAGTNGKGSVCAMIESVLRSAGFRTGLYTSPHLVRFHERIQVAGEPISDETLTKLCEEIDVHAAAIQQQPGLRRPTFFEFTTALAFTHFAREGVDYAVLETGMGGRWDATNVVQPLVSVIAPIDKDHERFLGHTIAEIAAEKAGIIKRGAPVVYAGQPPEAREIILEAARAQGAAAYDAADLVSVQALGATWDGQRIRLETSAARHRPLALPLLGPHQLVNCALAVAACELLRDACRVEIPDAALRKGLSGVQWQGRVQVLGRDPVVILDCAHNPAGARSLRKTLDAMAGKVPVGWIVGCSRDKDLVGFFREAAPRVQRCWVVPLSVERGASPDELAAAAATAGVQAERSTLEKAREEAVRWAAACGGLVVIAGSLYLAGQVLAMPTGRGR